MPQSGEDLITLLYELIRKVEIFDSSFLGGEAPKFRLAISPHLNATVVLYFPNILQHI